MKREHVTEECAVQVPMGSTSGTLDASAFHLANNADLVAVLKALQVILTKYSGQRRTIMRFVLYNFINEILSSANKEKR